jgi:hypothetical protein
MRFKSTMESKKQFLKAIEEGKKVIRGFRDNKNFVEREFGSYKSNG